MNIHFNCSKTIRGKDLFSNSKINNRKTSQVFNVINFKTAKMYIIFLVFSWIAS